MPDALEFAQWQGEQRAAANAQRMLGLAQLRQEAQRRQSSDADLYFRAREGELNRDASMKQAVAVQELREKQDEARQKLASQLQREKLLNDLGIYRKDEELGAWLKENEPRAPGVMLEQLDAMDRNIKTVGGQLQSVQNKAKLNRRNRIMEYAIRASLPFADSQAILSTPPDQWDAALQGRFANPKDGTLVAAQFQSAYQKANDPDVVPVYDPEEAGDINRLEYDLKQMLDDRSRLASNPHSRAAIAERTKRVSALANIPKHRQAGPPEFGGGTVIPKPSMEASYGAAPELAPDVTSPSFIDAPLPTGMQGVLPQAAQVVGRTAADVADVVHELSAQAQGVLGRTASLVTRPAMAVADRLYRKLITGEEVPDFSAYLAPGEFRNIIPEQARTAAERGIGNFVTDKLVPYLLKKVMSESPAPQPPMMTAPANPFAPPLTLEQQAMLQRVNPTVPVYPPVYGATFGTTPPELTF